MTKTVKRFYGNRYKTSISEPKRKSVMNTKSEKIAEIIKREIYHALRSMKTNETTEDMVSS